MRNTRSSNLLKSKFKNMKNNPVTLEADDDFVDEIPGNFAGTSSTSKKGKDKIKEVAKEKPTKNLKKLKVGESSKEKPTKDKKVDKKQKGVKENKKMATKKKKVDVVADEGKESFKLLKSRMSPNSMYLAVKSLSAEQRAVVRSMGFGAMLDIQLDSLPGKLSYYIVDNFCPTSCSILTDAGSIKITHMAVHKLFGLPKSGMDFKSLEEVGRDDPLVISWKNQFVEENVFKFNNSNYLEKIRESDVGDDIFKLNFLTLFINTFCETEMMGSCKINFLEKLVRWKDQIDKINWCSYMIDCLVRTKSKWKPNDKLCNYIGPQSLLVAIYAYWMDCEEMHLNRTTPLIKALDSEHLRVLEKHELKQGKFGTLPYINAVRNVQVRYGDISFLFQRIEDAKKELESEIKLQLRKDDKNEEVKEFVQKFKGIFVDSNMFENVAGGEIGREGCAAKNVEPVVEKTPEKVVGDGSVEKDAIAEKSIGKRKSNDNSGPNNYNDQTTSAAQTMDVDPSIPSFDLKLSQCVTPTNSVNKRAKPDVHTQNAEVHVEQIPAKRVKKKAPQVCSPYVRRVVRLYEKVSQVENVVVETITHCQLDGSQRVWESEYEDFMTLGEVQSVAINDDIHPAVIDCWACVLNKSEELKDLISPSRMFFTTGLLSEFMLDEKQDEELRYSAFESMMGTESIVRGENFDIKTVDIMFFPMVVVDHYYLILFNVKKGWVNIFDRPSKYRKVESRYGNRPRILQKFVSRYLISKGQNKGKNLMVAELFMDYHHCHNKKIETEHGVLLMRHMEAYMGEEPTNWVCGMGCTTEAKFYARSRELRIKYLGKLMLSEINILKGMFMVEYEKFDKQVKMTKMTKGGTSDK